MSDAWVLVRTTHRSNGNARELGQFPEVGEAWNHMGDPIDWWWTTKSPTCPYRPLDRRLFYFFLFTDVTELVEIDTTEHPVAERIRERTLFDHVERSPVDNSLTRYISRRNGLAAEYDEKKTIARIKGKLGAGQKSSKGMDGEEHIDTYFRCDREQPEDDYLTVDWSDIDGWWFDTYLGREVTAADLTAADALGEVSR